MSPELSGRIGQKSGPTCIWYLNAVGREPHRAIHGLFVPRRFFARSELFHTADCDSQDAAGGRRHAKAVVDPQRRDVYDPKFITDASHL